MNGTDAICAYHAVTERPMSVGQRIVFDGEHRNGVYRRVQAKLCAVKNIYDAPEKYGETALEHHTAVAIRELAMEQVRLAEFTQYPSRMCCLYVSRTLEEAIKWAELFAMWRRPTYHIVKLRIDGRCFQGDANNCFYPSLDPLENQRRSRDYWTNSPTGEEPITELLVDGNIEVVDIVKEINANL